MKKLLGSLIIILLGISSFAFSVVNDDELCSVSSLFEIGKEEAIDIASIRTSAISSNYSPENSMSTSDSIDVEFDGLIRDFIADTSNISRKWLDGHSTGEFQNLPHGIVIDPEGKTWVGFYGGISREFLCNDGSTINLRALHCFMPDGTPASFSPMEFFTFPDGSKDTIHYESKANGSCRGLTMMDDGNILWTSWSTLFKIDFRTGNGLARWHPAMDGFTLGSMTEAAHDPDLGLVYIGRVTDNKPVYMLDEDLNYLGNAIDTVPTLHRSILTRTKSDGTSQLFSGTIWDGQGIFVYESSNPLTEKFELVDTIGNEVVVTPSQTITYLAWPSCLDWYDRENGILLYGNFYDAKTVVDVGEVPPSKHASKWVFLDVDDDRQLGSFGVKAPQGGLWEGPYGADYPDGSFSPRGASFVGNHIYTIDFNLHLLQRWQIMDFADTLLLSLTVSDSVDSAKLNYGWVVGATDMYDEGLDEYDTLIASEGSFDAHFSNNLITDLRATDFEGEIDWDFRFQEGEGNGPILIEWDNTAFPNYGYFYLKDSLDGSLVNINMRDSSYYRTNELSPNNLKILYFYRIKPEFTANIRSGKAPLTVDFTDHSVGIIRGRSWSFGDGTSNRDKDPQHTYTEPGVYDVTLVINDGQSSEVIVKTDYISVSHSDQPDILSVRDIPDDQGGWVIVEFRRSGYDTGTPGIQDSTSEGLEMYSVEISGDGSEWITANSSVAYGSEIYSVLTYTMYDSSATTNGQHHFRVLGGLSEGIFTSDIYRGYSIDNIAPPSPGDIRSELTPSGISLSWNDSEAEDLKHYAVYRSTSDDFSDEEVLSTVTGNSFTDASISEANAYYYRIAAVDIHDNEGNKSEALAVTVGLGDLESIPGNFELTQNYPNPFNPITTLKYGLPEVSDVMISIYDISGKKIMEWNMPNNAAGWHQTIWNGTDMYGNQVSTGMYIYHLKTGEFSDSKKMVLMK